MSDTGVILKAIGVGVDRRAGFAGLARCGLVWACPSCSEKIQAERRSYLAELLRRVDGAGDSVAFATCTLEHHAEDFLTDVWDDVLKVWESVCQSRAYRRAMERFGMVGWVRVVEVTHGLEGWHVHIHALIVFRGRISKERAEEFGDVVIWPSWSAAAARRGRKTSRKGFKIVVAGAAVDALADYLAKAEFRRKTAAEVTMSNHKRSRRKTIPMFEVLADALNGDERSRRLWRVYEQASAGRRQMGWSLKDRDLRVIYGMGEWRKDEEIVKDDLDDGSGEGIAITAEGWRMIRDDPDAVVTLLDLAESQDDLHAAAAWLDARDIPWAGVRMDRRPRSPKWRAA